MPPRGGVRGDALDAARTAVQIGAMPDTITRAVDDGGPIWLVAPALEPGQAPCGHGVSLEMPLDPESDPQADTIPVELLDGEQLPSGMLRVEGEPARVALSLSAGACAPLDEHARRFLDGHPWLGDAIAEKLDWLRARASRIAAQRDRDASWRSALDAAAPGEMVPYEALFPADWDVLVEHGGASYWAVDHHCPNPGCTCGEVMIELLRVEAPESEFVGNVAIDLKSRRPRPKASTPLAAQLFEKLWAKHRGELLRRREEARRVIARRAADRAIAAEAAAGPRLPAVGRNEPCPCGSGKKYKRCCLDRDELARAAATAASKQAGG